MVRLNNGKSVTDLASVKHEALTLNPNYDRPNGLFRKILESVAAYKDSGEHSVVITSPYCSEQHLTFHIKVQSTRKTYNKCADKCMYRVRVFANNILVQDLSSRGRYIMCRQLSAEYEKWIAVQRGYAYYNVLAA